MVYAVVAIHTHPFENCNDKQIVHSILFLFDLAVPFFFLACGFLLAVKTTELNEKDTFDSIKNHAMKILKMYLVWTVIYLPIAIYHFFDIKETTLRAILLYLRNFIFIGEQYNSFQLWYLLSTIYSLAIIVILRIAKKRFALVCTSVIASVVSIIFSSLSNYNGTLHGSAFMLQNIIRYSFGNGRLFNGLVFIPIGMLIANRNIDALKGASMLIGGIAVGCYSENIIINWYALIIAAIGLFCIVISIRINKNKLYLYMRNLSTSIYLVHMYVWTFFYYFVYGKKTFGIIPFVFTAVISTIIGIVVILVQRKRCKL